MAATKIFPIRTNEIKAIEYIADASKTDNGRLIYTFGCSKNPTQAIKDFEQTRILGTGLNSVLSQHIIQSFKPNEITPEKALEIGRELCEKYLKSQYQYYIAVHTDKDHIHLHCIFNNVNQIDFRTFETHENQGNKENRAWKKLQDISDEICKLHNLSVIENAETSKGKSHYEWDMANQNLSWKAKLKFAIDQVVKESDDFDDFLVKCKAHNIEAVYNPNNVIDLKFRLAGQQRFTRARTLGWYYETNQIKRRIDMFKGIIRYTPKTKIIATDTERIQGSLGLHKWADIQNIKELSKAINIASKYQVTDYSNLENILYSKYAQKGILSDKLNHISTEIDELNMKIKVAKNAHNLKAVSDESKSLSGRKKDKFDTEHSQELTAYTKAVRQLKEWYPDGKVLSPESMEKKINALMKERSELNQEYSVLNSEINELNYARQTFYDYYKNRQNEKEIKRKKDELE